MTMKNAKLRRNLWGSLAAVIAFANCVEGGLNQNEREAGDGDEGVSVGFGEIAIDPTGAYFLSRSDEALVYGDLATGATKVLTQLSSVERVAFAHKSSALFATRSFSEERGRLVRYALDADKEAWSRAIPLGLSWDDRGFATYPWVDVLEDDSRLVLTYFDHVEIVDAASGAELFRTPRSNGIVDVDVTPDQKSVIITHEHFWEDTTPYTQLEVRNLATFAVDYIDVPNCSDELVLAADGKHAFLAPTTCQKDPVSVIDLEARKFQRNLPGFGPVALAPDGGLAIAFLDADNIDESLFDDKSQIPRDGTGQYHLMLINPQTLAFELVELGDSLPRYAVSPNGQMLLVDSDTFWDDGRIRVLDVATHKLATVKGPDIRLDNYVMTRDSGTVFLLDEGLYRIALSARTAQAELLEFTPENLNITPDDRTLVLRENEHTLWLYDVNNGSMVRSIHMDEYVY
jgi:hypothetical protein